MINTVLFDLDGTLLPMDQNIFVKDYFSRLAAKLSPRGYDVQTLIKVIWKGVAAMTANTGAKTNEEVFWDCFTEVYGDTALQDKPLVLDFYANEFNEAAKVCGYNPMAAEIISELKHAGKRLILATNPLFPRIATESRIRWAGLSKDDFELITTYEDNCHCKPNLDYYRDILAWQKLDAQECLMVGNSVSEDMSAGELGMDVFLLTDCLINEQEKDISGYARGGFKELQAYLLEKCI